MLHNITKDSQIYIAADNKNNIFLFGPYLRQRGCWVIFAPG